MNLMHLMVIEMENLSGGLWETCRSRISFWQFSSQRGLWDLMKMIAHEYSEEQLYICNETALYHRMLLTKLLDINKSADKYSMKMSKEGWLYHCAQTKWEATNWSTCVLEKPKSSVSGTLTSHLSLSFVKAEEHLDDSVIVSCCGSMKILCQQ
jgi:hypothetical protein